MIYIFDTQLSNNKAILLSLNSIYGIGKYNSNKICKQLGFARNFKVKSLSNQQIKKLIILIKMSDLVITNDLKKFQNLMLKTLISIKSYRGLRKIKGLPIRGQRTHTNAKTSRKLKNFK